MACGWLMDKYAVRWQIVPGVLRERISAPDKVRARRAAEAMMKQIKLDISTLEAAFSGS
jgi:predicted 3-demethylubiquinone-9 3-methyltransferase (glyoxalase superfamily)